MTRLVIGDETGLLKEIDADGGTCARLGEGLQRRARGVTHLASAGEGFYAARVDGTVETWAREEASGPWTVSGVVEGLAPECCGLFALAGGRALSVGARGAVQVSSLRAGMAGDVAEIDASGGKGAFEARAAAARGDRFLLGGRETEVALWDATAAARVWRARNVAHDTLDMRRPVFVTACGFQSDDLVVCGTAYGELRFYDVRVRNRRPVHEVAAATERGVRALAVLADGRIILGDAAGDVLAYDATTKLACRKFPGACGAIRALAAHPTRPRLFAAASLDRHVRVFDAGTKRTDAFPPVYAKQRLAAVAWLPDGDHADRVDVFDSDAYASD